MLGEAALSEEVENEFGKASGRGRSPMSFAATCNT